MKLLITVFLFIYLGNYSYSNTFYLDPNIGSLYNDGSQSSPLPSLEEVNNNGLIQSYGYVTPYESTTTPDQVMNPNGWIKEGDTLILMEGMHGSFEIINAHNKAPIIIKGISREDVILKSIHIRSGSNWIFESLSVSSEPYGEYMKGDGVWFETHDWHGPAHNIRIFDCYIHSAEDTDQWSASEWNEKSRNGIRLKGNKMTVKDCLLRNVNHGINCIGDSILVYNSIVENFCGDGMRTLGQYITIEANTIKNCFNVNDNHDDGIQSFNLESYSVNDITIRGNKILNHENPDHPLAGPLQGIACFDGPYHNWIIENNVIIVNHWHGISMYGAHNCIIRNNTVLDPTPNVTPGASWIRINPNNDGTSSSDNVIANNVTNNLVLSGTYEISNNAILDDKNQYDFEFKDWQKNDFNLLANSIFVDSGVDSLASTIDINGITRPQGQASDIGAYEYINTNFTTDFPDYKIHIFPNPAPFYFYIESNSNNLRIESIRTLYGNSMPFTIHHGRVNTSAFPNGTYVIGLKINNSINISKLLLVQR